MWAIPTGASWLLKKKKNQVKSPSPESRVPETGSDPPIGSGRESGRDIQAGRIGLPNLMMHFELSGLHSKLLLGSPHTNWSLENHVTSLLNWNTKLCGPSRS